MGVVYNQSRVMYGLPKVVASECETEQQSNKYGSQASRGDVNPFSGLVLVNSHLLLTARKQFPRIRRNLHCEAR